MKRITASTCAARDKLKTESSLVERFATGRCELRNGTNQNQKLPLALSAVKFLRQPSRAVLQPQIELQNSHWHVTGPIVIV